MFNLDSQSVVLNISGYRFVAIDDVPTTMDMVENICSNLKIKGSVFFASEGINVSLAGNLLDIQSFISGLEKDSRFKNMRFHHTYSRFVPFNKLVFKTKTELVPLGENPLAAKSYGHQYLPAAELQQWIDSGKEFTLLDMRNNFEFRLGTFTGAQQLEMDGFRQLPSKLEEINELPKDKPLVTFCTGGIRCEKAGPYLEKFGFNEVYQLDGGIIEYLRTTNGKHWHGNCFVFDDRVSLNKQLRAEHCDLCLVCQTELSATEHQLCGACTNKGVSQDVAV